MGRSDGDILLYRLALASLRGMTASVARELLALTGGERAFFEAPESELRRLTRSTARICGADVRSRALDDALAELRYIEANGIRVLYFGDADGGYPRRLAECEDAPPVLYTLGDGVPAGADCRPVAIVGTRHATPYGVDFTSRLVADLAEMTENVVIVSGLAYGVDVAAHRAALRAGVPTAAVMATPMASIYPSDHRAVAAEIVRRGGALITEYGHRAPIHKGNFVARNRIVAGLSDCVVVIESAAKGGALITAGLAAGYNRDVFALPGRVGDTYSEGCNGLIASNAATLVRSAADLCKAMNWPMRGAGAVEPAPVLPLALNPDEQMIVNLLEQNDDMGLTDLSAATGVATGRLMSILVDMEFRGLLQAMPGAKYRVIHS